MSNDVIRDQQFEHALPNSSEAERAILGLILLNNGLISQAIELLKPEDFYVPSHRRIFTAMIGLFERGAEINPILIGEELKKENALEAVGGVSFITNLTYGLPHSTNIAHYATVVRGKSMLRQLVKVSNQNTQEALAEEDEPEVIMDHAETRTFELRKDRIKGQFRHIREAAEKVLDRIQEQEGHVAALLGLTTGYPDLDKLTAGFQKQDLIILAARPSMGKTSLALMFALNAALADPNNVIPIFSLEMSTEALVMRLLCAHANIDSNRFRNGFLSRPEWAQIAKSLAVLSDTKIFIDDTPGISVLDMRAKVMRLYAEQKRIDLMIADYLQKMSAVQRRKSDSRQQEVSDISGGLKDLAKELDVPLVALSQLSRALETRTNKRPQLADLRESGSLEQDADVVAFIFREEQYLTPSERDALPEDRKNIAEIIIGKQRSGPTGTVDLRFTPSSMRFDNLYRETPALNF